MAARPGRGPSRPHRTEARREGAPEFLGRERERARGDEHPVEAADLDHERLLADFDAAMGVVLAETEHAYLVAEGDWGDRMRAALARLLDLCSRHPDQTRLCTLRVFEAGLAGLERRDVWMDRFAVLCQIGYADSGEAGGQPRVVSPLAAGALFELIRAHAEEGRLAKLPAALPTAVLVVTGPVLGRDGALALTA